MKYAIVDVFYDEKSKTMARTRYDDGDGYTLAQVFDLMWFIVKQNPETHYVYMEVIEG